MSGPGYHSLEGMTERWAVRAKAQKARGWIADNQDLAFLGFMFVLIALGGSLMIYCAFREIKAEGVCVRLGFPKALLRDDGWYCAKRGALGEDVIVPSGVK